MTLNVLLGFCFVVAWAGVILGATALSRNADYESELQTLGGLACQQRERPVRNLTRSLAVTGEVRISRHCARFAQDLVDGDFSLDGRTVRFSP